MTTTITFRTTWEDMRQMCIDHDWFDRGSNENYGRLLKYAAEHDDPTKEDILAMAVSIYTQTSWDEDISMNEALEEVIYAILNEAYRHTVDIG